jgi:hypothetical protein
MPKVLNFNQALSLGSLCSCLLLDKEPLHGISLQDDGDQTGNSTNALCFMTVVIVFAFDLKL